MISTISNDHSIPKAIRKKIKHVGKLWSQGNIEKLRRLRDTSTDLQIDIYHHSQGTDSYFHDTEKQYYTWAEIEDRVNKKLGRGEILTSVVIPYKANVHFYSGSATNPELN